MSEKMPNGSPAGRTRLDHFVIHVSDWERSNAFYREVLGAEVVAHGPRWVYRIGEIQLNGCRSSSRCADSGTARRQ
jgi:catechol 2,3-dioxygenase-like lactoylglutathione lyase family enzyme